MKTHAYTATVRWGRDGAVFTDGRFSRSHTWRFDGGIELAASASPHVVRLPFSREDAVDPEEAFVAALASCHMLTFLYLAAKAGVLVDDYEDDAVGIMEPNERGRLWVSRVTLRPRITFAGERRPTPAELEALHHQAHDECFIANSVKTEVVVAQEPSRPDGASVRGAHHP
ncbi:OsmC family protein [Chelatococcus reniformis]|uniref:Peroxiredoxin n=1 Tax=Chelatococcus reniformis TaxID=1494448 RepID=A0A916XC06_9HYPH|nr:OsmC family protein [Chelatococcus reniformis]GGC62794.1 peroxiredoxin [Chelatococcus reniformis]